MGGRVNDDTLTNLRIKVCNFDLSELNNLVFIPNKMEVIPVNAVLDSVSLVINGVADAPIIESNIDVRGLRYEGLSIGNFVASVHYENENISGEASIKSLGKDLFSLDIRAIPLYLGLDTAKPLIIDTKPMDISIIINDLQAGLFTPFIPSVDNINGKLKGALNIGGYLPDKYEYTGNISFDNLQFRIEPINMRYSAFGGADIKTGLIEFSQLKIKNMYDDLKNGEMILNGKVELAQTDIKQIDISAVSNNFMILSDKTEVSMP